MKNELKTFEFDIEEISAYVQTGTVYVQAENKSEALSKALLGDYVHMGDNKIDYDSEACIQRTINGETHIVRVLQNQELK